MHVLSVQTDRKKHVQVLQMETLLGGTAQTSSWPCHTQGNITERTFFALCGFNCGHYYRPLHAEVENSCKPTPESTWQFGTNSDRMSGSREAMNFNKVAQRTEQGFGHCHRISQHASFETSNKLSSLDRSTPLPTIGKKTQPNWWRTRLPEIRFSSVTSKTANKAYSLLFCFVFYSPECQCCNIGHPRSFFSTKRTLST